MTITYLHTDETCRKAETALRISNECWDAGDTEGYQRWRQKYTALLKVDGDAPSDVEGW